MSTSIANVPGRFVKGNPGGPGNPAAGKVMKLRLAMLRAVNPARLERLALRLYDLAMDGDMAAAKMLLSYTLGPPDVTVNLQAAGEQRSFRTMIEESFRADAANGHGSNGHAIIDVGSNGEAE